MLKKRKITKRLRKGRMMWLWQESEEKWKGQNGPISEDLFASAFISSDNREGAEKRRREKTQTLWAQISFRMTKTSAHWGRLSPPLHSSFPQSQKNPLGPNNIWASGRSVKGDARRNRQWRGLRRRRRRRTSQGGCWHRSWSRGAVWPRSEPGWRAPTIRIWKIIDSIQQILTWFFFKLARGCAMNFSPILTWIEIYQEKVKILTLICLVTSE